ncbi:hypothetical protein [Rhizobium sp. MHM7A]|uniref:hypothetical protein n=1 Tax=Rhizobium sp. MHM7A TaxID=2583233 RepID=UPI0011068F07|nr:hypothetical protein [Rhizobium sp. MHM7A]TLX16231.1 hypothetical protein FFR93_02570 [Rhizobium sp. MHM7A]
MVKSLTIEVPPQVREEDVQKMVAALSAFRGDQWWFHEENVVGGGRCLAPLVLQNMMLQFQYGTLEPSMHKFKNLLETAIFYEAKARELQGTLDALIPSGQTAGE